MLRVAEVTLAVGTHTLRTPLFGTPVKQLEPRLGRTIDGILGAELFARTAIEIDYQHTVIRYERESVRLRDRLWDDVEAVVDLIATYPSIGEPVRRTRGLVRRFPLRDR